MATNFPGSQDSFTNPTSSDTLDSPDHAGQHADANDAIEAIQGALLDGAPLHIDDANERVGIGTASPAANLQVVSQNRAFSVLDSGVNNNGEAGFTTIGGDAPAFGAISGYDVQIKTGTSRAGLATRMHIDNDGKIGIGTTSPNAELDIKGASNPEIRLQSTDSTDPFLYFGDQVDAVRGGIGMDTSANALQLRGYNNNTRMTIDSSGNVGIGTTSPSYDLDVVGRGRFAEGNNSYIFFGPNNTWGGNLYVGSTDNKSGSLTAQVIATDGNLHLDAGAGKDVYVNYYQTSNQIRMYGETIFYAMPYFQNHISLRSGNLVRDSIYRVGGVFFTWDSDSYGTNTHHSIRSTYGDGYTDCITINSYNHVRVNIDSNNNNSGSVFEVGANTTSTGNVVMQVSDAGRFYVTGNVQANTGVTVGGLSSANSINSTYADNSCIQMATDTYWGGAHNAHTGFLMWCGGMNGWSTAQLGFRVGNNWGSYHSSNPLRLAGTRTYINLSGESTYNVYADGGGRIGYYSSRRELKNHVADIAPEDALARIMQLQPIDFTWKKEHRPEGDLANELIDFNVHRGFYAEDAAAIDETYGTYGWVASEQDAEGGEVSHLEPITEPLDHYGKTLEDAVVVSYDDKAILADLVGSVKALESRIAQLETTS